MHNRIEKSGFRPGEYVGYCDGVWRITKIENPSSSSAAKWQARKADGSDYFCASTLDSVGAGLDERANIAVGKALFS